MKTISCVQQVCLNWQLIEPFGSELGHFIYNRYFEEFENNSFKVLSYTRGAAAVYAT